MRRDKSFINLCVFIAATLIVNLVLLIIMLLPITTSETGNILMVSDRNTIVILSAIFNGLSVFFSAAYLIFRKN